MAFVIYQETKAVVFEWEAFSRNDIPLQLNQKEYTDEEGKIGHNFYLRIWIQCLLTNSGSKAISAVSFLAHSFKEGQTNPYEQYWVLDWNLFESYPEPAVAPKEKLLTPIIVEPGHSKIILTSVDLHILEKLFSFYKNRFNAKEFTLGDLYRLSKNKLPSGNSAIFINVELAGGETKTTRVAALHIGLLSIIR